MSDVNQNASMKNFVTNLSENINMNLTIRNYFSYAVS